MSTEINVYCDESCHLEHDNQQSMAFGAVWCSSENRREVAQRINEIRLRHKMPSSFEFKWTKVGPSKIQMYKDVIDYFFDNADLRFRCLIIPNKSIIDHAKFNQLHDDWYYKMYFFALKTIISPKNCFNIYIDIKDSRSEQKVQKLHSVLCNNAYDFSREVIRKVQQIRSHESAQVQIADLLLGAMSYKSRGEAGSSAKLELIERISSRSGYSLDKSTLLREDKFNILYWRGSDE